MASQAEWKPTACILCECNCGIEVQLGGDDGRRLVKIRGDKQHPASQGYACEKAQRLDYYQNAPDRLTQPMRRMADGSYEAVDWDTAIREVADGLAKVRDTHGGETIFYYGGGGQGNHLPGTYATATRRALGSRYRSSALAQEKTGEFWIGERMLGALTRSDFEHCEVGIFLGKNPWFSHSIPRARVTLKELSKDPARTLIVIDPRRTKTAELADIHLQLRPGTDAWLMAALLAILVEEDLVDHAFLADAKGKDAVIAQLRDVDVAAYAAHCGIEEARLREVAKIIGNAKSVASFEDLGVQMNHHSTLVSYLHRLLTLLTGNLGKKGSQYVPTSLVPLANGRYKRDSPVAGARIVGGLVPCNVIAEEILTDHAKRYRAMIVEAANPAHSLADSPRFREAMNALDFSVVIDVAMTETARHADYVLPASTQFEKAEATFFNFEFPHNYFHLRPPLMDAPEGPLPEAEIHARICEALGVLDDAPIDALREAASQGLAAYGGAFMQQVAFHPQLGKLAPVILYRTLGPSLPDGLAEGAVMLGLALQAASKNPASLARAGFDGPPPVAAGKLFTAILEKPSGVVFAVDEWDEVRGRVSKIDLELDDMLEAVGSLAEGPPAADADFPFVLSAGERRSFTANTIVRDPRWRKKDVRGALRMSPGDATRLGLGDGDVARVTTRRGTLAVPVEVSDTMREGHVSLPNGAGLGPVPSDIDPSLGGVAPNELTEAAARDPYVGTPWHKNVPARIERV